MSVVLNKVNPTSIISRFLACSTNRPTNGPIDGGTRVFTEMRESIATPTNAFIHHVSDFLNFLHSLVFDKAFRTDGLTD